MEEQAVAKTRPGRVLHVGIAGFGTVGKAVARILSQPPQSGLRLTHIFNRDVERKKTDWVPGDVVWTDRIEDLYDPRVDVFVELVGGVTPAADWIRRALEAGKSVVTANKQVIAQCGTELAGVAFRHRRHLAFEAAVAGGIPVIRGIQEGLSGDRLFRILGILNGTCNYILTRMEAGHVSFEAALREAQKLGYAEADPSADIDGHDAQAKLAILAAVGLQRHIRAGDIPLRSIAPIEPIDFVYARRLESTIRQVSRAEVGLDGGQTVLAGVQPALVPLSSALARVEGSQNVVVVEGEFGGETAFSGHGAGGNPTAVAVVSDLMAIRQGGPCPALRLLDAGPARPVARDFVAPHYVRFIVADRPGIIASLADVFSRHGVNVDAVLQEPGWSKAELPFVVTLEACGSTAVSEALHEIEAFDFHVRPPLWLPVLAKGDRR